MDRPDDYALVWIPPSADPEQYGQRMEEDMVINGWTLVRIERAATLVKAMDVGATIAPHGYRGSRP